MSDRESGCEDYFCHNCSPVEGTPSIEGVLQRDPRLRRAIGDQWQFSGCSPSIEEGPRAELNLQEERILPAIFSPDIESRLRSSQEHSGKKLTDKTPVEESPAREYYELFEDPRGNRMCVYSAR